MLFCCIPVLLPISLQVLMDLGYYMDDEQFKELCAMLKFTNGHMNYIDFVQNFEDTRIGANNFFSRQKIGKCLLSCLVTTYTYMYMYIYIYTCTCK